MVKSESEANALALLNAVCDALAIAYPEAMADAVEGPRRELRKGRRLRLMSLRLMSPAAAAAAVVEAPAELAGGIAISSLDLDL